ncbi:MAG: glucose 1-dehydrogenase [Gemmatimonadaceae bacterium]
MNRVKDKVAIVSGGTLGLGRADCLLLAREGAKVVVTDLLEKEGGDVVAAIKDAGGEATFFKHDVGSEDDWVRVIAQTKKQYGRLDVVVNNAGLGASGTAEDTTLEAWHKLLRVNLDGVFLGTKHAILGMKEARSGSIINMSSIEGLVGDPTLAAYNASKGGVRLFTKSAALHCAKAGYGIRVNSVHPGYIWTPMVEGILRRAGDVDAGRATLDKMHPIGHLGEPNDIGWGVVYLASEESKFMTGSELVIDGGYTAQ